MTSSTFNFYLGHYAKRLDVVTKFASNFVRRSTYLDLLADTAPVIVTILMNDLKRKKEKRFSFFDGMQFKASRTCVRS